MKKTVMINISFDPEMVRAMFDCGKNKTSRLDVAGRVGDWFKLTHPDTQETKTWEITGIGKHPLKYVAMHMYRDEGFISESDFMKFWKKVYPKYINPEISVFVHDLKPKG